MLKSLHIENYAIIEHLDIDLSPSLNIITGETGAGKSILLGALGLLSGVRADLSVISFGATRCIVEGVFCIEGYGLQELFGELDLDYSDEIIVRRVIQSSGKSRAFIGDMPVTLQTLKVVSGRLIDIHSQHQTLLLSREEFGREIVDAIAQNGRLLSDYTIIYSSWLAATAEVARLKRLRDMNHEKLDFLSYQKEQLRALNLREGEVTELEERQKILSNAEEISQTYGGAASLLIDDPDNLTSQLHTLSKALLRVEENHSAAGELSQRIGSCYIELKDVGEELSSLALSIEADPRELEVLEMRLDAIYSAMRKFKVESGDELFAIEKKLDDELEAIDGSDNKIEEAEREAARLYQDAKKLAEELSKSRAEVVPSIESHIVESLLLLGIKAPKFKVVITPEELALHGSDRVELLFTANERSALQPISAVASGGEMSRVMLSIKSLVAQKMQLPSIIFDEIDTGVSGLVADSMGEMIENMSRSMQVVNITHLPQVAAKGADHFEVYKDSEGTHIRTLTSEQRVEAIAAMLSGAKITDAALLQATELLKK